jgi:aryl-alcohol dehydrogenase-like predicted oxidoreductase
MKYRMLGASDLNVSEISLGSWLTYGVGVEADNARACVDRAFDLGINFIDTANVYGRGSAETVLGETLDGRPRDSYVLATKLWGDMGGGDKGLSRAQVQKQIDASLTRLKTDYVDLYQCHRYDPDTPLEETMAAFTELQLAGKIRFAAASNYSGARLREASEISKQHGFIEYSALQNHYNLLEREEYERDSVPALAELGIEGVPFFGLARGFLSGKYREGVQVESVRASGVTKYTNEHGWAVLAKLDRLANHHSVSVSAIALAWLRQQPSVAAPIASARTVEQLREIMTHVNLSAVELQFLTD